MSCNCFILLNVILHTQYNVNESVKIIGSCKCVSCVGNHFHHLRHSTTEELVFLPELKLHLEWLEKLEKVEMEQLGNDLASSLNRKAFIIASCEGSGIASLVVEKATEFLQQEGRDSSQLIVIGRSSTEVPATVFEFFVQMFRKHGLHRNERETILGPADQLIATQLVLASQNQKDLGEFSVDVSKVLEVSSKLIHWKLSSVAENNQVSSSGLDQTRLSKFIDDYNSFLRHCNSVDWMDVMKSVQNETKLNLELQSYISGLDFLVLNPRDDLVERNLICELAKGRECATLSMSLSLDESFSTEMVPRSAEFTIEKCSRDEAVSQVSSSATSSVSISDVYAVQIFLAYLELLVNSRNELALARVINIPDRKLDHSAFTDIKHEAKRRKLSMYQTIISFITRVRLGGKSYASEKECLLVQHCEGLERFTDFMDKLQTVIEEDSVTQSAIKRILNVIKANIIRGCSRQLKTSTVQTVATQLLDQVTVITNSKCLEPNTSPTHNASDGGSLVGRRTMRVIRTLLDHFASLPLSLQSMDVLTDSFALSQKTPTRFPSLMSKFRSPEECNEPCLAERLAKRTAVNESRAKAKFSVQNQLHVDRGSTDFMILNCPVMPTADHMPRNISLKPNCTGRILESSKDQENDRQQQPEEKNHSKKLSFASSTNTSSIKVILQPSDSNTKETTRTKRKAEAQPSIEKKSKVLAKSKVIPQIKGQQNLSKFFRI